MGFQSAQNAQLGSKTGYLPKQVIQKHIFELSQTLGAVQRPKMNKEIGTKGGPKYKSLIMKPNWTLKHPKFIVEQ